MTTPGSDNRPHPGSFSTGREWADEIRGDPLPVSGSTVPDTERDAELRRGLAKRIPLPLPVRDPELDYDRRLSWEELFTMFRSYGDGRVSIKKATEWADVITTRGVRRR